MSTLSPTDLLAQLQWRYATKQFDPARKISAEVWSALEEALVLTPSSFGLQPWKFIVVTNPAVKQQLLAHSWKQAQPVDCSHHVVFAAKKNLSEVDIDRFLASTVAARGGSVEALAGYRGMMVGFAAKATAEGWIQEWAVRQVYIALGNFMTSCAVIGVDTCPMEGIVPAKYDEVLGLAETGYATVAACATGYRLADDKYATLAKVRYPTDEVIKRV